MTHRYMHIIHMHVWKYAYMYVSEYAAYIIAVVYLQARKCTAIK